MSWIDRFRTPAWRPYRAAMFVGLGASGVVPMIQGLQSHGFEAMDERMSLSLVTLQGLIYIFGAFLYAVCPVGLLSLHACVRASQLTISRPAGRRGSSPESLISGGVHTNSSISASSSRRGRIYTPCREPLITIIQLWARSAHDGQLSLGTLR